MQPHAKGWHAWDSFDDGLYNARGFMKPLGYQPNVWHWHGFKPSPPERLTLSLSLSLRGTRYDVE